MRTQETNGRQDLSPDDDRRLSGRTSPSSGTQSERLSAEEERSLFRRYRAYKARRSQQCGKAVITLVEAYRPLVIAVAETLHRRNGFASLADMIANGNLGLLSAIRRFDPERGYRFSTFAVWDIRRYISEGLRGERWPMTIPDWAYRGVMKLMHIIGELSKELGHVPSIEEISRRVDWPEMAVRRFIVWTEDPFVSLDVPVGTDRSSSFGDFISDSQGLWNVHASVEREELQRLLADALDGLPRKARKIITLRFGLNGDPEKEASEVGKKLNLSTKTVRMIEKNALDHLRKNHGELLRKFL